MSHFAAKLLAAASLLIASGLAGATAPNRAATAAVEPELTIVNVASHCDWSWGHTRAWHENRYADMIHDYLMLMRANPKLVWQLETVNEQLQPFLDKAARQWPELIDEFWQRVRQGRIEVVCGYSNPRLSEVYPELFVRSLVLGKEYFRRRVPTIRQPVLEVPDLMCGTSQVPQILKLADYRYFMFTRPVSQQVVFWRKGLDGTRILCCKDVYGYPELQGKPGAAFPGINPLPVWRYAIGCDDMPPTPATVAEATAGDPKRRVLATMLRFFQECEKYSGQITELSGPLDSCNYYTAAGLHGGANIHTQHNQNEDLLLTLEKAQAMAAMLGRSFVREPVDGLWQDVLSCTGHAIEWCWKEDYAERMAKGRHTREKARRFLEEALAAIAGSVPLSPGHGSPLLVFNFHEWPVSGPVEFAVDDGIEGLTLSDVDDHDVPLQFVAEDAESGPRTAFNAAAVPACGFKTFYLRRAKSGGLKASKSEDISKQNTSKAPTIENEFYRISVRSDGRLHVFDKGRGTTLGSPQTGGFGDLVVYDMPPSGDTWLHVGPPGHRRDWRPAVDRCQTVQGPVFASLLIPGTIGAHAITREVRLWRNRLANRIRRRPKDDAARQRHLLHPLPHRHRGQSDGGNPLRGRIARSSRAGAVSRRELLHRLSRRLRRHPLDRRFVAAIRLHLHLSARHAQRLCVQEERAGDRVHPEPLPADAEGRFRPFGVVRGRQWAASLVVRPVAPCGNLGRRPLVPPRAGRARSAAGMVACARA